MSSHLSYLVPTKGLYCTCTLGVQYLVPLGPPVSNTPKFHFLIDSTHKPLAGVCDLVFRRHWCKFQPVKLRRLLLIQ
ncbi:hypothetical protein L1987_17857 [Smallanthus sonchifolius]|uniref:Uncharacterized protein n=1 Tax=Smallanthus sonchifolius TaxID=185202 RepID=A0ACB9IZ49_9ASTR|nr:hypothetical protein L1987_17857 [Smallanthus sonchifolius]